MTRADFDEAFRARIEGFERFARWEESHPARMTPADAVASIGAPYEVLAAEARRRPVDLDGWRRWTEVVEDP